MLYTRAPKKKTKKRKKRKKKEKDVDQWGKNKLYGTDVSSLDVTSCSGKPVFELCREVG